MHSRPQRPASLLAFGQQQESRPLGWSKTGRLRLTDFPSIWQIRFVENTKQKLCACSEIRVWPVVVILGADQNERGLWIRECRPLGTNFFLKVFWDWAIFLYLGGTNFCDKRNSFGFSSWALMLAFLATLLLIEATFWLFFLLNSMQQQVQM